VSSDTSHRGVRNVDLKHSSEITRSFAGLL